MYRTKHCFQSERSGLSASDSVRSALCRKLSAKRGYRARSRVASSEMVQGATVSDAGEKVLPFLRLTSAMTPLGRVTTSLPVLPTSTSAAPPPPTTAPPPDLPPLTRVAVLGAGGPAGLAVLSQLLAKGISPRSIVGYEARSTLGGVWNHVPSPGECAISWRPDGLAVAQTPAEQADPRGTRTAREGGVYDGLRTNLPKNVMAFRGHGFPEGVPLFPTHEQVLEYLVDFARTEGLEKYIELGTTVESVYHTEEPNGDAERWTVRVSTVGPEGEAVVRSEYFSHISQSPSPRSIDSPPPMADLGSLCHSRHQRPLQRPLYPLHPRPVDLPPHARPLALVASPRDRPDPKHARRRRTRVRGRHCP